MRYPSAICHPTPYTGFRLVIGSWKIIDTRSPRTLCISRSERARRFRPSSSTEPDSIRPGGVATRRRIESAVTVFPQPLSPTRATVEPRGTSNDTPSTARNVPESERKLVTRSRTRSSGASSIPKPTHSTDGNVVAMRGHRRKTAGGDPSSLLRALGSKGSLLAVLLGCSPPPRMCISGGDCGPPSSCVAGRCVARGAVPAISTARRLLYGPVDVGYVSRGASAGAPAIATLGRGDGAFVLLRFSVPLPVEADVLEAYVLIERVSDVDSDPEPIALHAARVTGAWDDRSLSWAQQPRVEEAGAPVTRVLPAAGRRVRLDVRDIVARWRR